MALFITQCPHCQTIFRTSVSQLQSADGMVRCGACLRVFVADDNLLPSVDLQTINQPVSDELLGDEPEDQLEFDDPALNVPETHEAVVTLDLADALPNRVEPAFSETEPSWEFLEDAPQEAQELPELKTAEDESIPIQEEAAPAMNSFSALDTGPAFLLDNSVAAEKAGLSQENLAAIDNAGYALELDWQSSPRKLRSAAWGIAAFFLTVALLGQLLYQQWNSLAQNLVVRTYLERLCTTLPCELQTFSDIQALRSESLVIRSHTEIANALNVTLVFRNDSRFAQAYPMLNLHFMNASTTLIAARQFLPDEYLPAEISALGLLPAGAPVQVSFDILDPGIEAINYEVSFSPVVTAQ